CQAAQTIASRPVSNRLSISSRCYPCYPCPKLTKASANAARCDRHTYQDASAPVFQASEFRLILIQILPDRLEVVPHFIDCLKHGLVPNVVGIILGLQERFDLHQALPCGGWLGHISILASISPP